ncbi:hypothetical protein EVAR_67054_1 [Eumeta japonica]|uniref:Uncharacterized protein n=1 Tax=Eumeta variegata TaxID=151549 RepID=A0A4C1ZJ70_EUMVA|nr:hypothetical protein EVAR_67054_1 [Eumeta japonica]
MSARQERYAKIVPDGRALVCTLENRLRGYKKPAARTRGRPHGALAGDGAVSLRSPATANFGGRPPEK